MKNFSINQNKRNNYVSIDAFKIFFYVIVFLMVAVFVTILLLNGMLIFFEDKYTYAELINLNWVKILLILTSPIVFCLLFFIYNKRNKINIVEANGFKTKLEVWILVLIPVLSLISIFCIGPFIGLWDYFLGLLGYLPDGSLPYEMNNIGQLFAGVVLMAVIPAVFEELIFRGIILKGLMSKYNKITSIILSAIFFVLMHTSLQQTLYQFYLGLLLGGIVAYGGSIFYSIILHFLNNFIVVIITYCGGLSIFTPMEMDISMFWKIAIPIILVTVGVFLTFLILKYIFRRKQMKRDYDYEVVGNIIEIKSPKTRGFKNFSASLTTGEKSYFYSSIIASVLIWLSNSL